jgi:hypothetical protein
MQAAQSKHGSHHTDKESLKLQPANSKASDCSTPHHCYCHRRSLLELGPQHITATAAAPHSSRPCRRSSLLLPPLTA